jgi:futalosine hydrolase
MKFLLVAATKYELSDLIKYYALPDANFMQHTNFDVLITGVGMTATAFALGKHLTNSYALVVNVGIAGSFDQQIPLGSVVNIYSDCFAELGAENNDEFITIDELGFGTNTYLSSISIPDLPKVKGITVNKVHGNEQSIFKIKQLFDVQTESMEGAAVFYSCEKSNIPCLQVRAISNYVVPRAKEGWKIELAIRNLNEWLMKFIDEKSGNL